MANIVGKYELTDSEKFDEYMAEVGVNYFTRKMAGALKPTTFITKEGDEYNIKTVSTFKTTDLKFKLGKKFHEETADGRKCESIVVMENDNKMKHNQLCMIDGKEKDLVMYREFNSDGMIVTLLAGTVVCKRTYKRAANP